MVLNRKADISDLALEASLTAIKGTGWSIETLVAIYNATVVNLAAIAALNDIAVTDILSDSTAFAGASIALIKTQTDKVPNLRFEDKLPTTPVAQNVASASATNLTAGSVTPTFPTGATRQRAMLLCFLHVSNQAANTHNIGLKVQGQKPTGGYVDQLDLTAVAPISLVNVAGATATFAVTIDVTTLVDTSTLQYDFRFVVDSDNAGSVNYTSNFVLVLTYSV